VTIWGGPAQGAVEPCMGNVGSRQSEGSRRGQVALRVTRGGYGDGPGVYASKATGYVRAG
jgi:hypothetical protein